MAAKLSGSGGGRYDLGQNSEINVTPFVDVMLVLLIIFMVAAPLATAIGLFAAIPAVMFYNNFQSIISSYGTRTEGFVAELMNNISRQLDKGA